MVSRYIREVCIDWQCLDRRSYVLGIPSLRNLTQLVFDRDITFFVGENGTGKSTLLEAIAVAYGMNPEGGSKNFDFSTKETHSGLHEGLRVVKGYRKPKDTYFLRAESFYNVATRLDEYEEELPPGARYQSYGGKSLHEQSHGESFLSLMQERFSKDSIYFLDEPEASLSPQKQLTILIKINELVKQGTQFIIASHSPILLGIPNAKILSFDSEGLEEITYEETSAYQVTEMFINNRKYLLDRLLSE